jgi:hypothetical protein
LIREAHVILPARLAGDAERLRRFTQEAKAASALHHPSILTIYDVDEVDGQPFLVSEFIEGPASPAQGAAAGTVTPASGGSAPGDRARSGAAAASGAAPHATVTSSHSESASAAVAPASTRRWPFLAAVAMLVVIGVVAFAWRGRWLDGRTGARGSVGTAKFTVMTIEKVSGLGRVFSPTISPDGKLLAYVTTEVADTAIWLRQMATGSVVKSSVRRRTPSAASSSRPTTTSCTTTRFRRSGCSALAERAGFTPARA